MFNAVLGLEIICIDFFGEFIKCRLSFSDLFQKRFFSLLKQSLIKKDDHSEGITFVLVFKSQRHFKSSVHLIFVRNQDFAIMLVQCIEKSFLIGGIHGQRTQNISSVIIYVRHIPMGGYLGIACK